MCLSVGCEKAVSGFSCQADLNNHESSHSQPFRCIDGCAFNDVSFTTVQQLRSHIRKRHPSSIEVPVPKRFKRCGKEDSTDTNTQDTTIELRASPPTENPPIWTQAQQQKAISHLVSDAVRMLEIPNDREVERLNQICYEEGRAYTDDQLPDVVMDPEQHAGMITDIQLMLLEMNSIGRALGAWYRATDDDNRARMFFRMVRYTSYFFVARSLT